MEVFDCYAKTILKKNRHQDNASPTTVHCNWSPSYKSVK